MKRLRILALLAALVASFSLYSTTTGVNTAQQALLEAFCDACGIPTTTNLRNLVASTVTLSDAQTVTGAKNFSGGIGGSGNRLAFAGQSTNPIQLAVTQTTPPTCATNCGTSPTLAGSDTVFKVTMGASGSPASGFIVTFNGTWSAAPICTGAMMLAGMVIGKLPTTLATTTTTLTVVTNGTAPSNSDVYGFQCMSGT